MPGQRRAHSLSSPHAPSVFISTLRGVNILFGILVETNHTSCPLVFRRIAFRLRRALAVSSTASSSLPETSFSRLVYGEHSSVTLLFKTRLRRALLWKPPFQDSSRASTPPEPSFSRLVYGEHSSGTLLLKTRLGLAASTGPSAPSFSRVFKTRLRRTFSLWQFSVKSEHGAKNFTVIKTMMPKQEFNPLHCLCLLK